MQYANWFRRVIGHVIDVAVPAPFFIAAAFAGDDSASRRVINAVLVTLGFLVSAYNRFYRAGRTGQSWGRRAVGIRLVDELTGRPIGPVKALIREIAHLLDSVPMYVGYLFPLWTAKRQTIADKLLRSVVIT